MSASVSACGWAWTAASTATRGLVTRRSASRSSCSRSAAVSGIPRLWHPIWNESRKAAVQTRVSPIRGGHHLPVLGGQWGAPHERSSGDDRGPRTGARSQRRRADLNEADNLAVVLPGAAGGAGLDPRRPRDHPGRRRLGRRHRRGRPARSCPTSTSSSRPAPARATRSRRASSRLHRRHHRDDRRRRQSPTPPRSRLRRGAGRRRRLRQGHPLRRRRRQRRHHRRCAGRATRAQRLVNVVFGTEFTDLCYGYNAFWTDMAPGPRPADADAPPPSRRRDASGATASRSRP